MGIVSQKLRDSAKGQSCKFQIVGICTHEVETVVFCHIRDEAKGMANKANDFSGAFGCQACHDAIDQHRLSKEDELFYSLRAMQRTQAYWIERGLISIPKTKKKPRRSDKIMARRIAITGDNHGQD